MKLIVKGFFVLCKAFYYKSVTFSPETGVLRGEYAADGEVFCEEITFPGAPFHLSPDQSQTLNEIFHLWHIAAGISYYKAFLPPKLVVETAPLTPAEARFFEDFYLNGLGEFAVRNHLNLQGKIHFPSEQIERYACPIRLSERALVPVGGGKDSCVTLSLLKETGHDFTTISVGSARPITDCQNLTDTPALTILRRLDPKLSALNASGRVLNGHVPITGILAFVLWAAAILYNDRYVILSCERSANVGNLKQGDLSINHQYSKSLDFERAFYELTQRITPDFRYFSLLRPLSEAHIARLFAEKCDRYFPVFTSCNKAFRLDQNRRLDRWCADCDKCRFVFLILAPFMDRDTLIRAVGKNLLDDLAQTDGYRELLGLQGHKPFECVGEIAESRWALQTLATRPEWQADAVVQTLGPEVPPTSADGLFEPAAEHLIPQEFSDVLVRFRT